MTCASSCSIPCRRSSPRTSTRTRPRRSFCGRPCRSSRRRPAPPTMLTHHMRKEGMSRIVDADDAREAIRGTTALVDGARLVYALWKLDKDTAKPICDQLEVPFEPGRIVRGAVVKANDEADYSMHTYVRQESGLLVQLEDEPAPLITETPNVLPLIPSARGPAGGPAPLRCRRSVFAFAAGAGALPRSLSRPAVPDGPESGRRVDHGLAQQRRPDGRSVQPQNEALGPQGAAMAMRKPGGEGGAKSLIYKRRRVGGGGGAGAC